MKIFRLISYITFLLMAGASLSSSAQTLTVEFTGLSYPAITVQPENNTGLDAIFVIYNSSEIQDINISGFSGTDIAVSKYSNLGGGYAIDIPYSFSGGSIVIPNAEGDMGYLVKVGDRNYCFWVVNYLPHKFSVNNLNPAPEQSCDVTVLDFSGNADAIKYFTIDGRQKTLSRDLILEYENMEWNEDNSAFAFVDKTHTYESLNSTININPPFYCNTTVKLTGDRFLTQWGIPVVYETPAVSPTGISVMSIAEQEGVDSSNPTETPDEIEGSDESENEDTTNSSTEEGSNMIRTETSGLGGSAPATIEFRGYFTDAVLHTEWQMARDADFNDIEYRWNEQDVTYTFNEEGQFFLRFIGSNADGSCEAYGETYTVNIGASDLRIPNAFSPNGDGVNDVWKVGYRSLVEFKCWIFDSRGTQIFYFDRPEDGWDGKYKGKSVNPGVYYYVIEAKGADGKKYKKGGDINIVNYRKLGTGTSSAPPSE